MCGSSVWSWQKETRNHCLKIKFALHKTSNKSIWPCVFRSASYPDFRMKPILQTLTTPHETQLTAWIHRSRVSSSPLPHQHSDLNRLCHLKALSFSPPHPRILCTVYPLLAMTSWPWRLWDSRNADISTSPMCDISCWEWSEVKKNSWCPTQGICLINRLSNSTQ